MRSQQSKYPFPLALILALLSGAAGLGHQWLWTRRLVDLLGASGESTARVFGAFFLGLALGAALAARVSPQLKRPWRALGAAELGVALLAFPIYFLPAWSSNLWSWLGPEALTDWRGGVAKALLSVVTVMPPAILMGFVLPILARAVVPSEERLAQSRATWLYGINTLGGALGLVIVGLWLLPKFSTNGAMISMIGINLCIGGSALLAHRFFGVNSGRRDEQGQSLEKATTAQKSKTQRNGIAKWLAIAALSGMGVLAVEIVFVGLFQLAAIAAFQASLVMLLGVIIVLAVASMFTARFLSRIHRPEEHLGTVLGLAALGFALAPIIFMSDWCQQRILSPSENLGALTVKLLSVELLSLGPGLFFAALAFPILLARGGRSVGADGGRNFAFLLAANGVGGFIGAELAYRFLLPAAGVHLGMGAIACAYGATALILSLTENKKVPARVITASCLCVSLILSTTTLRKLPLINEHVGMKLVELTHGREGQVATISNPQFGRAILVNNQYLLGSEGTALDQQRQAHLPLVVHPNPARVGVIGLATGSTAAAALEHPEVKECGTAELSPLVVAAAKKHFAKYNDRLFSDPRSQIVAEDGRTWIAAHQNHFDVIIADLFLPWGSGSGRLFSVEHYRDCKRALRSGGVFCHWLPMHQLTPQQAAVTIHSFAKIFGKTHLIRGNLGLNNPSLGLIGFKDATWDDSSIKNRIDMVRKNNQIRDPFLRHYRAFSMLQLGAVEWDANARLPLNTLGNGWLERNASAHRLLSSDASAYLKNRVWLGWCEERINSMPQNSESAKLARTAQFLSAALKLHQGSKPVPASLIANLRRALTGEVLFDQDADHSQWPYLRPQR